ncbi:acyl-CoA dehydrogenase family protein [Streptomyces sp. CA-111067]|uniref:acyl-CoA dehydrogenase family protein n=1 Tax=Streptomyces sp. CA-111067 TaxID=3240046 RepID=UPI003D9827D5
MDPVALENPPPTREIAERSRLVAEKAAVYAGDVDRRARFPGEAVAALRESGLLVAVAPHALGGGGLGPRALLSVAAALARGCASSAMVWAMHQAQLACLVRHGCDADLLRTAVAEQWLIASVTSEKDVGGELRTSRAALDGPAGGERHLTKEATAISYGAQADAFLLTCRTGAEAAEGDQAAAVVTRGQVHLTPTGSWDTLGMRGTCSPPFTVRAEFPARQILPVPFQEIAAATLVPLTHLLWAGVWTGLADEALHRARMCVRRRARSGQAAPPELALIQARAAGLRAHAAAAADSVAAVLRGDRAPGPGLAVELNALKLAVSDGVVDVVGQALRVCGMAGFAEDAPTSVARLLRDAHSAPLMISNSRLAGTNAQLLLLAKGE